MVQPKSQYLKKKKKKLYTIILLLHTMSVKLVHLLHNVYESEREREREEIEERERTRLKENGEHFVQAERERLKHDS